MSKLEERESRRRSATVGKFVEQPPMAATSSGRRGRPKEDRELKKRISLSVLPSVYEDIQKIAYVQRRSVSELIGELLEGARAHFLRGWLSEAVQFERAQPEAAFCAGHYMVDDKAQRDTDYYYVRVRQRDGQWGWCSPIWVERA